MVGGSPQSRRLRSSAAHLGSTAAQTIAGRGSETLADDGLTAEQLDVWRRDGCLIVRGLFTGEPLARLQAAFAEQQVEAREEWAARTEESWHADGYFDLHRPLERDRSYCELLATPKLASLLKAGVGDDVQVVCFQARTVPATGDGSYAGWHVDGHDPPTHPTLCASVKLFVQVFDHTPETGCTAVVPGSRNFSAAPADVLPAGVHPADMPGHVQFTGKAGDAMLMDLATWHAAIPSTIAEPSSSVSRAGIIIQASPCKDKQEGFLVPSAAVVDTKGWIDDCAKPTVLRQLLGFGPERYGGPDFPPHTWQPRELSPVPDILRQPIPKIECPEQNTVAQAAYFRKHGFCIIRELLHGDDLIAMQESFRSMEPAAREKWAGMNADQIAAKQLAVSGSFRADSFFDWPVDPMTQVRVLRSKKLVPLLADLLGNDVQCLSMGGRTVPADQASSESYTRWHRDYGRAAVGLHEHGPPMHNTRAPLGIKMFIAVTDHTPNMGCTSFVPGTHRIKEEPRSVWESGVPSSTKDNDHDAHTAFQGQSELPHVRFSGKAGDCCIMDLRTWHTAMENTTDRDRHTIIASFDRWGVKGQGERMAALEAAGELPDAVQKEPMLRQMLGIARADGADDYYSPQWLEAHPRPDMR